ncbi:MAG TPA: hypothetical protein VGG39_01845 [Polyangiaceae bacterium]|jgi:hypothetical protein
MSDERETAPVLTTSARVGEGPQLVPLDFKLVGRMAVLTFNGRVTAALPLVLERAMVLLKRASRERP